MHSFSDAHDVFYLALVTLVLSMSFWFRGATVRLYIEMQSIKWMSHNSLLWESHNTYLIKRTLDKDNSLCWTGKTGVEHALDLPLVNVPNLSKMGYSWIWNLRGPSKPMKLARNLLSWVYGCNSLWVSILIAKHSARIVYMERLEGLLKIGLGSLSRKTQQYKVPVNHRDSSIGRERSSATWTVNASRTLWGRGLVVPAMERGLNTEGIRSYSTKFSSEALSWKDIKAAKRLKTLWEGNNKDPQFINMGLFKLLNELDLWKMAYIKLARSKGSNTPSFDKVTIDGTTLDKLIRLKDELTSGRYNFGLTKKVLIPKTNGKLRPLGIPAFDDRIIQEVVRSILEIVYEPIFSNHSHGFRPGRGCHTALRQIRKDCSGFSWAIEGDIEGFFPNIDHDILTKLLEKKIKDPQFIALIYRMLKAKVKEQGKPMEVSEVGSPQGAIISPILSNILLHELDMYMEDYIKKFRKGKNRKANPKYMRAYYKHGIKEARKHKQASPIDPDYRRMSYVRYADDFIVTIIGSKEEATQIKQDIANFLENLKLKLSPEKTLITNPSDQPASFLGYLIQKAAPKLNVYYRTYAGKKRRVSRMTSGSIFLKVDAERVKKRLSAKGFCKPTGEPIANFKYLPNTQFATILQVNYIIRGLATYYKLAENSRQMISRWNYIIRFSIAKMFAAKYRTNSIAKIFAIAGKDLGKPIKSEFLRTSKQIVGQTEEKIYEYLTSIGIPKRAASTTKNVGVLYTKYRHIPKSDLAPLAKNFGVTIDEVLTNVKPKEADPLRAMDWLMARTVRLTDARCTICSSPQNVEMHHIKGLKYLKGTTVHSFGGNDEKFK